MKITLFILIVIGFLNSLLAQISPDEALAKLMEGNKRFLTGKSIRPNQTIEKVKELASGQKPFAVIVGCSDSRVPNEIIFDQGLGDIFIIRTAGQVSSYASWGSMEFAVTSLNSKLILVLGHTKCGAVSAACTVPEVPGHIVTLEPVLSKKVKNGEIKIEGAVYHIENGKVELIPDNYLNKISKEKK